MKDLYFYSITIVLILFNTSCNNNDEKSAEFLSIQGHTMGTTYAVQYQDSLARNFKMEFDSVLKVINQSMSTYDPNSIISNFNEGNDPIQLIDAHFKNVFEVSQKIYHLSEGYFNPTVYPLVKYWGFANRPRPSSPDSAIVDSLLSLCDFDALNVFKKDGKTFVRKEKAAVQLDFSAVAKGYAVDLLANFLQDKNIENYLVEIGGEVKFLGVNPDNKKWSVGIDYPIIKGKERKLAAIIKSNEDAIATSGNYRNFYQINRQRFAHILNPKTGYSYSSNILSATVLHENCAEADALATALMIGGKALFDTLSKNTDYQLLLIESVKGVDGKEQLKPIMSKSLETKVEWLLN